MFEFILLKKISLYLSSNSVIPDQQFGFRKIIALQNKYIEMLRIPGKLSLDKVCHQRLLYNLLPSNNHKLFKSHITDRTFEVKSKRLFSRPKKIQARVAQDSILGPILQLIYTFDILISAGTHTSTIVYNTAVISIHKRPIVDSGQLQEHVLTLEKWLEKFKIIADANNCTYVTFTLRRDTCPALNIFNSSIPQKYHVK